MTDWAGRAKNWSALQRIGDQAGQSAGWRSAAWHLGRAEHWLGPSYMADWTGPGDIGLHLHLTLYLVQACAEDAWIVQARCTRLVVR
jgi:hypothetical protein